MNYREATDYIEKLQTEVGSDLSLKQIKYLADNVGNPENKSRIIQTVKALLEILLPEF